MKKGHLQIIVAGVLYGFMGIFVRELSLLGISQIQISLLRVFFALLVIFPMILRDKEKLHIKIKDLWCFLGTGVISLTLFNVCYFNAMQYTTLSVAAVLVYTSPVFVMIFSAVIFHEKITATKLVALVLVCMGCICVTGLIGGGKQVASMPGILLGLGAGVAYSLYSIFGRLAFNRGYHAYTVTGYTFLFSCLSYLPFAHVGELATKITFEMLLYGAGLGIVSGALPYLLYTKGLETSENTTASMLVTVEPAVATFVSVLFYREPLSLFNALGIVLLFIGIIVLARKSGTTQ